jgi:hypothetical protein
VLLHPASANVTRPTRVECFIRCSPVEGIEAPIPWLLWFPLGSRPIIKRTYRRAHNWRLKNTVRYDRCRATAQNEGLELYSTSLLICVFKPESLVRLLPNHFVRVLVFTAVALPSAITTTGDIAIFWMAAAPFGAPTT